MGFMVFGFVIDLKTLHRLCVVLAGVAPGLLALLMDYIDKDLALLGQAQARAAVASVVAPGNSGLCELTNAQMTEVQNLLASFNASCNVTLAKMAQFPL